VSERSVGVVTSSPPASDRNQVHKGLPWLNPVIHVYIDFPVEFTQPLPTVRSYPSVSTGADQMGVLTTFPGHG
jgi:hypothetical protein